MASTTNATTVLYGTAWSDTTLLAQQSAANQELQERTGQRQHFAYDWQALAAINPAYRRYVEQEIERLGEDHIAIQTQYLLHTLSGADYLLTDLHRIMLQGTHFWENEPGEGWYIAGMDVAGEERPTPITSASTTHAAPTRSRRDSTVITIARVYPNDLDFPVVEVVHHEWWTGRPFPEQHHATIALVEHWDIHSLVIDATGLGESFASHLQSVLGAHRIKPFKFTRPTKSHLGNQMLKFIRCGQLKLYTAENAPRPIFEECQQQLRHARQRLLPSQMVDFYVDASDGHDDFLISLALLVEAAGPFASPSPTTFIRPRQEYTDESPF
jgi:terminase large subunit-like protein